MRKSDLWFLGVFIAMFASYKIVERVFGNQAGDWVLVICLVTAVIVAFVRRKKKP